VIRSPPTDPGVGPLATGTRRFYAEVMRIIPLLTAPAVALLALSGCAFVPRGPVVSEDREIDAVTSVTLDTSGDLTIRQGEPSLVIHAPESVLDRLTSDVSGDTLVLGVRPGTPGFTVGRVSYELTLPSLEGIEINGSGDVESNVPGDTLAISVDGSGDLDIDDIDTSEVTIEISGSGDVELSGRTDDFTLSIDGSAEVRADELDAARVSIDLDGSGDIEVAASDTLDVSISGSGSVLYEGSPEVTQEISGSGEVGRR